MPIKFNSNKALKEFYDSGGKTNFPDSLKKVLLLIQNDDNISSKKEASYLLATAKVESDYSLQRWESDFLCGDIGVPYKSEPCQKALNYYRSSDGKQNYYNLGVDSKGLPYFGRGLIQLTGKSNYDSYGKKIGVDLVKDGDKALIPKNSYKIASEYLSNRTFKYVNKDDLTKARKSVNGGTKGLNDTNNEYQRWLTIFTNDNPNQDVKFKELFWTRNKRILLYTFLGVSVVGFAFSLAYFTRVPDSR